MLVLFLITRQRPEPWAGWVLAFAEAGMIGALADWFAVVALFRHPLGLPIPHTAIIPRRKNEIGASLARFVADHFLHPDAVQNKLESVNLAEKMAHWLQTNAGRERVVDSAVSLLSWMTGAWREQSVRRFVKRLSRDQIERLDLAPLLGRAMDWLLQDGRHQQVLTQALRYAVILLHDNRETIRGNVQRESPWWLPGFVDDRIVQQMLDRIETLLLQMSLDPDHPVRSDFDEVLQRWSSELRQSAELRRAAEAFKQAALENEALQEYLYELWMSLVAGIDADLQSPESSIRKELEKFISDVATGLREDTEMQALVNRWLVDSAVAIVEDNRHAMASLISDTVDSWDADETSQRVELAIGHDLQYIRINGTLVGGLVGLLIHALTLLGI
ncbi:MAG TPA: DUF445 domain-containing protein, partial [Xanthomonadales bacterium]|nr:DUF445 domain-containing protein [Xanthomonadales bacterium]